ncbi:MAG: YHS domain protein [Chitinophagaceae bacterium]|nr:YHS domain protein [Chitinophagaceae bacterium]
MKHFSVTSTRLLIAFALVYAFMVCDASAQSASKASAETYNVTSNHLAINGYDPVAYFTDNVAKEGKKELNFTYNGIVYRFSSMQHLQAFKSDPEKYKPQYGGWCAYAMGATGEKVDIDPETFKVLNGKLYLFYNRFFNNTKKSWDKDEANLKQKADANWQKLVH